MLFELNRRAKLTKEMEMVRMLWKEDSKQLAEQEGHLSDQHEVPRHPA